MGKVIAGGVVLALGAAVATQVPEIKRYLRVRSM